MISLVLEDGYQEKLGWNYTLMRTLARSGVFDVSTVPRRQARFRTTRGTNFNVIKVGGKVVGVDTWDSTSPIQYYFDQGEFGETGIFKDLDLIIKIQYCDSEFWRKLNKTSRVPIVPWGMFPTKDFPLGYFQWNNDRQFKYTAAMTGRYMRFGRNVWSDWVVNNCNDVLVHRTEGLEEYLQIVKDSRWGFIFRGLTGGGDGKNRREVEYSSCGIPLAMNYCPYYPFDFVPGVHFVHIDKPEILLNLKAIDPRPFAKQSKFIYDQYFSPVGMSNLLVKLVKDNC